MLVTADGSFCNDAQHLYHVHVDENVVLFHYCNGNNSDFTSLNVQVSAAIIITAKYIPEVGTVHSKINKV